MDQFSVKKDAIFVVFGASGDLAHKKTFPALFNLCKHGLLPENFQVLGYARSKLESRDFKQKVADSLTVKSAEDEKTKDVFLENLHYLSGQYDQEESIEKLESRLQELEKNNSKTYRFFYLAVPPSVFVVLSQLLKKLCSVDNEKGFCRIIVEKPFGMDLESAKKLQANLEEYWKEIEVLRMDHYLGKSVLFNILNIRKNNPMLSGSWNNKFIERIEIIVKENAGVEGRGGYFNDSGIFRDFFQNHLMQILAIIAAEIPQNSEFDALRTSKAQVLKYIPEIKVKDVIVGQYTKSEDGEKHAYLDEDKVPKDSRCATYGKVFLSINNDRWKGVVFILECGKALDENLGQVKIFYKKAAELNGVSNTLTFNIQPEPSISIDLCTKPPSHSKVDSQFNLKRTYKEAFPHAYIPDAYEALFFAALSGDYSKFVKADEIFESWRIFTPFLHEYEGNKNIKPVLYPYGSNRIQITDFSDT